MASVFSYHFYASQDKVNEERLLQKINLVKCAGFKDRILVKKGGGKLVKCMTSW